MRSAKIVSSGLLLVLLSVSPSLAKGLKSDHADEMMLRVRGGDYVPFSKLKDRKAKVFVESFNIDAHPVTVGEFLRFVRSNPRWRKSKANGLFADGNYLRNWSGDLDPGKLSLSQPVTYVSWFAARAYAEWVGKQLPTTDQWEFAYKMKKIKPVGEDRWEWVDDFNSTIPSDETQIGDDSNSILSCGGGSVDVSDPSDYSAFLRFAFRSALKGSYSLPNLGFRCVRCFAKNEEISR